MGNFLKLISYKGAGTLKQKKVLIASKRKTEKSVASLAAVD